MSNFAKDIEEVLNGEEVEAVLIGKKDYAWRGIDDERRKEPARPGELLSWDEARPMLDYSYDDGYGGEDCDAVYVWTASSVLLIAMYDGSTWVTAVPRHPVADAAVQMIGGG